MTQKAARKIDLKVLSAHYLDGKTLDQIATKLGVTRQRVHGRIRRAQKWVKNL